MIGHDHPCPYIPKHLRLPSSAILTSPMECLGHESSGKEGEPWRSPPTDISLVVNLQTAGAWHASAKIYEAWDSDHCFTGVCQTTIV